MRCGLCLCCWLYASTVGLSDLSVQHKSWLVWAYTGNPENELPRRLHVPYWAARTNDYIEVVPFFECANALITKLQKENDELATKVLGLERYVGLEAADGDTTAIPTVKPRGGWKSQDDWWAGLGGGWMNKGVFLIVNMLNGNMDAAFAAAKKWMVANTGVWEKVARNVMLAIMVPSLV